MTWLYFQEAEDSQKDSKTTSPPLVYCEIDPGAQRVLLSRMARGEIPAAPIWDDVTTLRGTLFPGVDSITGGFPCQDISSAGTRKGLEGSRSGLVFEFLRLVRECQPRFVFVENVSALSIRGLDRILLEFHALGYDARWTIVSAQEMGAPHLRERLFILAHANGHALRLQPDGKPGIQGAAQSESNGIEKFMADPDGFRESQLTQGRNFQGNRSFDSGQEMADPQSLKGGFASGTKTSNPMSVGKSEYFGQHHWAIEPDVGRVAHGVADRINRLRILGNGVVPAQAKEAFERLVGFK